MYCPFMKNKERHQLPSTISMKSTNLIHHGLTPFRTSLDAQTPGSRTYDPKVDYEAHAKELPKWVINVVDEDDY
ncbi:hypothetical protein CR513_41762, partial [Mucuna pruriens]